VATPQIIDDKSLTNAFKAVGDTPILDLWLMYHEIPLAAPVGHAGRVIEQARVHFTLGCFNRDDAEEAGVLHPDDPMSKGVVAVFLGSLGCDGSIDSSGRVYVSAVGSRVIAPSGSAVMQVGQLSPDDGKQFAVAIRDGEKMVERFAVETDGRARVNGSVLIQSRDRTPPVLDLGVWHRKQQLPRHGLAFHGSRAAPAGARPWSIYRASVADPQTGKTREQLRVELQDPGKQGSPPRHQLVIGTVDSSRHQLRPILTVNAAGDLIVGDPDPSARAILVLHGGIFIVKADKPDGPSGTPGGSSTPVPGRLQVAISITPVDPTNWTVPCRITVNNIGPYSVSSLLLAVRVSARRGAQTESNPPATIAIDGKLASGQSAAREQTFPIPGARPYDKLIVGVTAMGVDSAGTPVSADLSIEH
jgi:hypothetical protein